MPTGYVITGAAGKPGGQGGIRTHEVLPGPAVLRTAASSHLGRLPVGRIR